jgi:type II secretory pathway component GspD/PulD (secretin)
LAGKKFKKIINHDLTEPILQLKRAGKSLREIQEIIREKRSIKLGINQLQDFLQERPEIIAQRMIIDKQLEQKHVEAVIDSQQQFIRLNNEMQNFFTTLREKYERGEEKAGVVIRGADHLLKQLRLVAELMGQINQKRVVNLAYHDHATNIRKILDQLYKGKQLYCKKCKSRDIGFDSGTTQNEMEEI